MAQAVAPADRLFDKGPAFLNTFPTDLIETLSCSGTLCFAFVVSKILPDTVDFDLQSLNAFLKSSKVGNISGQPVD
jgi:hypothetical protein